MYQIQVHSYINSRVVSKYSRVNTRTTSSNLALYLFCKYIYIYIYIFCLI